MTVIGIAEIRDWDEGCMQTLGAEVVTYTVDGSERGVYACDVPGMDSGFSSIDGKVPCEFVEPEGVFQPFRIPCFQFRRSDMAPAFERHPWYQWVARGPAKTARKVTLEDGTVGYTEYENQWRATPFDISYECNVIARRQQDSALMLTYALRHFLPPSFIFRIIDSLGDVREYDAVDVSVTNASELIDIAERVIAWSVSFVVRGEVDLHDSREFPAMLEPRITYEQFVIGEED